MSTYALNKNACLPLITRATSCQTRVEVYRRRRREGRRLAVRCGRQRGVAGQARARMYGEVLPGLQWGRDGLEMAEVVNVYICT